VPISFLVNNAGFGVHGDFFDHDPPLRAMLDLNMARSPSSPGTSVDRCAPASAAHPAGRVDGGVSASPYYGVRGDKATCSSSPRRSTSSFAAAA